MVTKKYKDRDSDYPWLKSYPKDVDWYVDFSQKPLFDFIDEAAKKYKNFSCLDFLGKKYSYQQTNDIINQFAKGLQDLGVKKGTRVGLFLPNVPYFVFAYYAVLKIGGIIVNYNPLYAIRELIHQQKDSGTEIFITLDLKVMMDKMMPLIEKTDVKKVIICPMEDILPFPKNILFKIFGFTKRASIPKSESYLPLQSCLENDGVYKPVLINVREDIAVLQYTGGTTGIPKGAMLTHANLVANTEQAAYWFHDIEAGKEKMLGAIPLFHVFAMTAVMNLSLKFGIEIFLHPRFDLKAVLKTIATKKITLFPAVPTIYTAILNDKSTRHYDLSSIKMCISGGAPLPLEVKTGFESLTGCSLVEGYGLSETSPVVTINPLSDTVKKGSIGQPVPGTIIELTDLENPSELVGINQNGEICVRGPQVMKGYWQNEEATQKSMQDGRFHTGDVGYMDEDGFVYIIDRIKDLILAGGYNVYPRNVEEAIYLHPDIKECIVAGVPDPYRGQTVKAFIVLKENATLSKDALKDFLKDKLSAIEIPKIYEFRDELPKTMIGKLSRKDVLAEEGNLSKRA